MNRASATHVLATAVQNQLIRVTPVVPHVPEYYAPDAELAVNPAAARIAVVTVATFPAASVKNVQTAMSVSYAATVNVKTVTTRLTPVVPEGSAVTAANALYAVNAAAVTTRDLPRVPV